MRPETITKLKEHQRAPAAALLEILRLRRTAIDASITGAGKTYVASACTISIGEPTLVVCPKVAVTSWERAATHFGDSFSIIGWEKLRTGRTPFGSWEHALPLQSDTPEGHFRCTICQRQVDPKCLEPCPHHHAGIHCLEYRKKNHRYGKFKFHPAVKLVVFDEIHRAANDSLNADMVIAAKRQNLRVLGLSATPASSPLHMRALGYLLDLHQLYNFERWAARRGCRRVPMRGFQWMASDADKQQIMREIRSKLIPARGIRLTEKDIPDFPECHISAELYDLPAKETAELDALYAEIADSHKSLQERAALDVNPELPLTKRLRARQLIELLKVSIAAELGRDYLDKNHSVVWFVNFRATIDELFKRFPDARIIDGTCPKDRQSIVDGFQRNDFRELIVNSAAGGISLSLQDLLGDFPRVGLVFPCDSAVTMRQLFGRLARDGGKSAAYYRVLFASRSVEVPMRRALAAKLNCLDSLTDGDLQPENLVIKA